MCCKQVHKNGIAQVGQPCFFLFGKTIKRLSHSSLTQTVAHGCFKLRHSWEMGAGSQNGTDNLMDYGGGTDLYVYQWQNIHDPVGGLGWFQDVDAGKSIKSDVFTVIELIRNAAIKNTECKIPLYSSTNINNTDDMVFDNIVGFIDWITGNSSDSKENTIKDDLIAKYTGLKFKIIFDESSIQNKVCSFNFDNVDIQPYQLNQTEAEYGFQSVIQIVTKDQNKRALVEIYCKNADVDRAKEFLFSDIEKDCDEVVKLLQEDLKDPSSVDISIISAGCAKNIPIEDREKLIRYILSKDYVSEGYEHALLALIEHIEDEDADKLIEFLRTEKIGDNYIFQQLMSDIDDIRGKDYYTALMQVLTRLLLKKSEYQNGIPPDLAQIILVGRKPWISLSEKEFEYQYTEKPEYNSAGNIIGAYKVRLLKSAALKESPPYTTSPTGVATPVYQYTYLDKVYEWETEVDGEKLDFNLDPLSLVFISKYSENENVEDILQEEASTGYVVPALLLIYNEEQVFKQELENDIYISIDAASLLISGGTLTYLKLAGATISKLRKALLLLEIANGLINMSVNATELSVDPDIQKYLLYYNLATAGFNIACGAKNVKWLKNAKTNKAIAGCENITGVFVGRMSKYPEKIRLSFFNDFKGNKPLLARLDALDDIEFEGMMKWYDAELVEEAARTKKFLYIFDKFEGLPKSVRESIESAIKSDSKFAALLNDNEDIFKLMTYPYSNSKALSLTNEWDNAFAKLSDLAKKDPILTNKALHFLNKAEIEKVTDIKAGSLAGRFGKFVHEPSVSKILADLQEEVYDNLANTLLQNGLTRIGGIEITSENLRLAKVFKQIQLKPTFGGVWKHDADNLLIFKIWDEENEIYKYIGIDIDAKLKATSGTTANQKLYIDELNKGNNKFEVTTIKEALLSSLNDVSFKLQTTQKIEIKSFLITAGDNLEDGIPKFIKVH